MNTHPPQPLRSCPPIRIKCSCCIVTSGFVRLAFTFIDMCQGDADYRTLRQHSTFLRANTHRTEPMAESAISMSTRHAPGPVSGPGRPVCRPPMFDQIGNVAVDRRRCSVAANHIKVIWHMLFFCVRVRRHRQTRSTEAIAHAQRVPQYRRCTAAAYAYMHNYYYSVDLLCGYLCGQIHSSHAHKTRSAVVN